MLSPGSALSPFPIRIASPPLPIPSLDHRPVTDVRLYTYVAIVLIAIDALAVFRLCVNPNYLDRLASLATASNRAVDLTAR
jgi:hypothetical protein